MIMYIIESYIKKIKNLTELNWKIFFFFLSKDLSRDNLSWNRYIIYRHFYKASQQARHLSAVRDPLILNRLRVKRSALFSTGVKACPQENMAEVITGHKSYYKLRGWMSDIAITGTEPKIRAKFVSTRASLYKSYLACLSSEAFWDRNLH